MTTVLITGAAKRLGKHLALYLAERGCNIALHCNQSLLEAKATATRIRGLGVECEIFVADLANVKAGVGLIEQVADRFEDFSVLVNSASVFGSGTMLQTDEELFDMQMAINLKAPFFLTKAFASTVESGSVVNILDTYINTSVCSHTAYLLAKKALGGLIGTAARELGPDIRVNGVAPGLILPSSDEERAIFDTIAKKLPLRRSGSPEDIAKTVAFLLDCKYITGEIINVDGGRHLI